MKKKAHEQLRQRAMNMSRVAGKGRLLTHTTEMWADSNSHRAILGIGQVYVSAKFTWLMYMT